MSAPVAGGGTRLDALRRIRASNRGLDPELELPRLPPAGWRVWRIFCDLSGTRKSGEGSVSVIPYSEIWAWCQLHGEVLDRWEIVALRRMDDALVDFLNGKNARSSVSDEVVSND